MEISLALVDAAQAMAELAGRKMVFAIFDAEGNLHYFRRMDGTSSGSVKVAQQKAYTAASFPFSTKQLAERSSAYGSVEGFLLLEGGEPIFDAEGKHIGGIGVSGATPEIDGQIARGAIETVFSK